MSLETRGVQPDQTSWRDRPPKPPQLVNKSERKKREDAAAAKVQAEAAAKAEGAAKDKVSATVNGWIEEFRENKDKEGSDLRAKFMNSQEK